MSAPGGSGSASTLTVVSYNLRYATADDGHPWSSRRGPMLELLRELAPDVLGTQEGLDFALAELVEGLPGRYGWVGRGRGVRPDESEFGAVFYDTTRFDVVRVAYRWLSDDPEVPGSMTWGNDLPRMITHVTLLERRTGRELEVVNTHLDHVPDDAVRLRSVAMITDYLGPLLDAGRAVVVTGDFNASAGSSRVYERFAAGRLVDAVAGADEVGPLPCSCPSYEPPEPDGDRIDWVFTSPALHPLTSRVVDTAPGGIWPSDHLPVEVRLRW